MKGSAVYGSAPSLMPSDLILEVVPLLFFGQFLEGCNPNGFRHDHPIAIIAIPKRNNF
jgi:hypothetical protein